MITQKIKVTGEITARCYDQSKLPFWAKIWNKAVRAFKLPIRWYILGDLVWSDCKKNVVCNAGLNTLTRRLVNDTTYSGVINKMALGNGSGTPAKSDTALFNEVYRNNTASGMADSNIAYLTAFFSETEVSGTFTEFGNFIDGGSGAGTGRLWTHVSVNWTKTNTQPLVIDCKYTFN